jgi:hypothetical protein
MCSFRSIGSPWTTYHCSLGLGIRTLQSVPSARFFIANRLCYAVDYVQAVRISWAYQQFCSWQIYNRSATLICLLLRIKYQTLKASRTFLARLPLPKYAWYALGLHKIHDVANLRTSLQPAYTCICLLYPCVYTPNAWLITRVYVTPPHEATLAWQWYFHGIPPRDALPLNLALHPQHHSHLILKKLKPHTACRMSNLLRWCHPSQSWKKPCRENLASADTKVLVPDASADLPCLGAAETFVWVGQSSAVKNAVTNKRRRREME